MSKFFKNTLAAATVASLMVFGASTSFAEVGIKGGVSAGFGMSGYTPAEGDGMSGWDGQSQAQIDVSGGADSVTAKYRLRVREGDRTLAATRHAVNWKTTDALTLEFWGQSFGLAASFPGYGAYTVGYFGDGHPIGDSLPSDVAFFVNMRGLNVDFNLGTMAVGVSLLNDCRPTCSTESDEDGKTIAASEQSTMVPHFRGKFGAINLGVFMAMASGKNSAGEGTTGSETNINLAFATDGMKVGFEYAMKDYNGDATGTGMALGVHVAGVEAHYVSSSREASGFDLGGFTEIAAAYRMKLTEQASMAPAYASYSETGADGATGDSKTWMGLQIGTSF